MQHVEETVDLGEESRTIALAARIEIYVTSHVASKFCNISNTVYPPAVVPR